MDTTDYFERIVKVKRPEAREETWIRSVMDNPHASELQPDGRICQWGYIREANKWLRVITENGIVHNAFFDRGKLREWSRPS